MTSEQKHDLNVNPRRLTEAEISEGCHYCADWDQLMICRDDSEFESCTCFGEDKN